MRQNNSTIMYGYESKETNLFRIKATPTREDVLISYVLLEILTEQKS